MAFQPKTDFCGLSAITELANLLLVKDANDNASSEKYQPQGQDGSFVATEVFGADSAPSNSYGVKGDISLAAGKIKLNAVTTVQDGTGQTAVTHAYALESVDIKTSAGSPPSVSATSQEVEATATTGSNSVYLVPALTLAKTHSAQILFGAFSPFTSGATLTECSAKVSCGISKDKVAGVKITSDANSGVITVSGTVLQTGGTRPTLTPTNGWTVTGDLNRTNPESAYPSYSFELQKVLEKTAPAPSNGGGGASA